MPKPRNYHFLQNCIFNMARILQTNATSHKTLLYPVKKQCFDDFPKDRIIIGKIICSKTLYVPYNDNGQIFVFMFITASYAKGVHGCLYMDASLKFIIRTSFCL